MLLGEASLGFGPMDEGSGRAIKSIDRCKALLEAIVTLKEYKTGQAFPGVIGRTFDESKPAWPAPTRARDGAPNVLFIILDDTGFGQLGCFGSPIPTPNNADPVA